MVTTAIDVEQEVRRRLDHGESAKDIATALTILTGQPRRKLYQLALHLKDSARSLHADAQAGSENS